MELLYWFIIWSFVVYFLHYLAHTKYIPLLNKIHSYHHKINYFSPKNQKWNWKILFLYYGWIYETLDVWIIVTIPLLIIVFWLWWNSIYLILFHYLYEVFLNLKLDHNPNLKWKITKFFAIGSFHMKHHLDPFCNYWLFITFWDYLFNTAKTNA